MDFFSRILAGFTLGFRYRRELKRLLTKNTSKTTLQSKNMSSPSASIGDPALKSGFPITPSGMTDNLLIEPWSAASILNLDPADLMAKGIQALALDFDGVLAHHGAAAPLPEAVDWIRRCEALLGGERIFILSNKPTDERRLWFAENFPAIRFIAGVRKKPYPDGLNKTGELTGVPLSSILMVDDRLLTGCLAALITGATPCYIRKPYISFSHRFGAELFFILLRSCERFYILSST